MDLCSCSKAWTERRQLGIIFQLSPLSSVSPTGAGTNCRDDVMYWCRVEMHGARQSVWHLGVSAIVTYHGENSMTSSIPLNIVSRAGWMGNVHFSMIQGCRNKVPVIVIGLGWRHLKTLQHRLHPYTLHITPPAVIFCLSILVYLLNIIHNSRNDLSVVTLQLKIIIQRSTVMLKC